MNPGITGKSLRRSHVCSFFWLMCLLFFGGVGGGREFVWFDWMLTVPCCDSTRMSDFAAAGNIAEKLGFLPTSLNEVSGDFAVESLLMLD